MTVELDDVHVDSRGWRRSRSTVDRTGAGVEDGGSPGTFDPAAG
jgi:hypothetical protein